MLKKEVELLPNLQEMATGLHDDWIKPLTAYPGTKAYFMQSLSVEKSQEVRKTLTEAQKHISTIKQSQNIHDVLALYARYLVELRLSQINGDTTKASFLLKRLRDTSVSLAKTISDIKMFEESVRQLHQTYHCVNMLLEKELSLEEALYLMDLPHRKYLHTLLKTMEKQKGIVRDLGRHFVSLTKVTGFKKA